MPLGGQALGPLEAQREMGDVLRPSTSSLADLPSPPSANDVPPAPGIPGNVCVVNGKRFNFIDTTVPVLIIGYLGTTYWIASTTIAPLLRDGRVSYLITANTLLPALLWTYLQIHLLPWGSAAPPHDPPPPIQQKLVSFVCADDEGNVGRCWKDGCGGRWKPERSRHCSVCRTCMSGFDHHCPWYGSCVNFSDYLAFVAFLLLVPPAVITLGRPLFRPCLHHFRQVWSFARSPSGEIKRRWLDWSWSWLFGIGPFGREGVAIVWGYWKWEGEVEMLGRGWLAVMLGVGMMLSLIAIFLAGNTILSVIKSENTIESRILRNYNRVDPRLRSSYLASSDKSTADARPLLVDPRFRIWIPSGKGDGSGRVLRTRVERPFDMGWKENLRLMAVSGWRLCRVLPWTRPTSSDWARYQLRLNTAVYRRLLYEASLLDAAEGDDSEEGSSSEEEDKTE